MKELFNQLITKEVKPYLKSEGFDKKTLSFYKRSEELIYLFNFQKSHGNSASETTFYINCGIHSLTIDRAIGMKENVEPKEYECYFHERISALTNSTYHDFSIYNQTSIEEITTTVLNDLKTAIGFFNGINSSAELSDIMIERNGLENYSELFEYLLKVKDDKRIISFSKKLFCDFGMEDRWKIFEGVLNDLLEQYKYKLTLNEVINLK